MRIAIVDASAARATVIQEGLADLDDCELFVITERRGLVARIGEIAPDVVLIDLGNPSRDVLEEYFAVTCLKRGWLGRSGSLTNFTSRYIGFAGGTGQSGGPKLRCLGKLPMTSSTTGYRRASCQSYKK